VYVVDFMWHPLSLVYFGLKVYNEEQSDHLFPSLFL
jgi:hypothetical protein